MRSIYRDNRCFILVTWSSISLAHEGATGIIKERMERFKENKEGMKVIKGNLGKDITVIIQKASEIETWANEMANFFPEGSNQCTLRSPLGDLDKLRGLQGESGSKCKCRL